MSASSCTDAGFVTPPNQPLETTLNTTSSEQHPHFSYEGRYLVFASNRQGKRSIWLYDTQSRRLLPLPGLNQPGTVQDQPDISADGRYIVYRSEQLGKSDIYLYDRTKAKSQNLTRNFIGEVRNPSISGNGRFVSFEGNRSGQWNIEIYDRGTGIDFAAPQDFFTAPPETESP